jgi:hypothetical protein
MTSASSQLTPVQRAADEAECVLRDAIGRLAIAFGRCESAVSELVSAALGARSRDASAGINAVLSFRQKLDLIAAVGIARVSGGPGELQLAACIETLNSFEERRNTLLHSKYSLRLGPEDYFKLEGFARSKQRAHRKKGLVRQWVDVNVKEISELALSIERYTHSYPDRSPLTEAYWLLANTFSKDESAA